MQSFFKLKLKLWLLVKLNREPDDAEKCNFLWEAEAGEEIIDFSLCLLFKRSSDPDTSRLYESVSYLLLSNSLNIITPYSFLPSEIQEWVVTVSDQRRHRYDEQERRDQGYDDLDDGFVFFLKEVPYERRAADHASDDGNDIASEIEDR